MFLIIPQKRVLLKNSPSRSNCLEGLLFVLSFSILGFLLGSATFIVTVGGWAYLPVKIFRREKFSFENILFFRCLKL